MCKAIIIRNYGDAKVLELEKISLNEPGDRELLIRHTAIGVNYHDIYVRSGLYKTLNLPGIPGCEAIGIIEKIGSGVKNFKKGDRIVYITSDYGAYATHRMLSNHLAIKVPDMITDEVMATNFLRSMTVKMLLEKVTKITLADTILVTAAAGGVGRLLCQWANSLGVCVIGTVSNQNKVSKANSYGCKYTIVCDQNDVVEKVMNFTGGKGVDVVYDSVGSETFEHSLATLKKCGHLVNYGQSSGPVEPLMMSTLAIKSLTVSRPILFHFIEHTEIYHQMAHSVFDFFMSNRLLLPESESYPLKDASITHDILESRRGGGSLYLIP
ncbi:MAG TPA: quinone oxidoreductase [SAR324 cluster bacterium]|jgi:NADPH2:quinone reductase|nr:quinone oxidoreductase [SAR324 cluster bacterium]|tara:strand:- start:232 stop:1206 length:975 start_codon:yes stop_codon:yes gene_type:complete